MIWDTTLDETEYVVLVKVDETHSWCTMSKPTYSFTTTETICDSNNYFNSTAFQSFHERE